MYDLLDIFKKIFEEFKEIQDSLDDQTEISIMNLKNFIDLKADIIIEKAQRDIDAPKPLIYTHNIKIKESINPGERPKDGEEYFDEMEDMWYKKKKKQERILYQKKDI